MFTAIKKHFLIILVCIAGFLYFFNLNWGAPYYFHPDERNVASAVSQLHFPDQLNPHFFAYGSLPIYAIFFTGLLGNIITKSPLLMQISFEQAIIISRLFSAFFAVGLIPMIYIVAKNLTPKQSYTKYFAAIFAITSVGFLQFSHFGTFEMWLTFFSVLLFWICISLLEKKTVLKLIYLGLVVGALVAIKISSLALLPLPLLTLALAFRAKRHEGKRVQMFLRSLGLFLLSTLFICLIAGILYVVTNPFVLLDTQAFLSSMQYESGVGFNTVQVFYTQGFYDTLPIVYQFLHIYPFLLNPILTILLLPSFFYLLFVMFKKKDTKLFLLLAFFLILFVSQSILFIKWTRYLVPTLPFVYVIIAVAIVDVIAKSKATKQSVHITLITLTAINAIFALSYFITAFIQPDTRLAALAYAKKQIPDTAPILSETYDLGITPFNEAFPNITLFNSYDSDTQSFESNKQAWAVAAENAEYIILPSQRVLQTRILNKDRYPVGNRIYASLINETSNYQLVYQTPCDIFCQITYLGDPVYHFEQTANVFDRPTVFIFKKKE